jgi:hypothetical protein
LTDLIAAFVGAKALLLQWHQDCPQGIGRRSKETAAHVHEDAARGKLVRSRQVHVLPNQEWFSLVPIVVLAREPHSWNLLRILILGSVEFVIPFPFFACQVETGHNP